jgi:hypothetical protein
VAVAVVAAIFVLVPSFMLPVVVVVVMVLTRRGDRKRPCYSHEQHTG